MSYELTSQAASLRGFGINEFADFKVVPVLKQGLAVNTAPGTKTSVAKVPTSVAPAVKLPPPPLPSPPRPAPPPETPPPAYVDLNLAPELLLIDGGPPAPGPGLDPAVYPAAAPGIDPMILAAGAGLIVAVGVGVYFVTRKGK